MQDLYRIWVQMGEKFEQNQFFVFFISEVMSNMIEILNWNLIRL